jgi:hypothetical protein
MRENPCKHNDVRLSSEPSVSHGEIQLTTGARSGSMTVAGAVSTEPTSVTVKDNSNSPAAATVYEDNTFARQNVTLLDGNNTFTAVRGNLDCP